jgi:hypothetical protein
LVGVDEGSVGAGRQLTDEELDAVILDAFSLEDEADEALKEFFETEEKENKRRREHKMRRRRFELDQLS